MSTPSDLRVDGIRARVAIAIEPTMVGDWVVTYRSDLRYLLRLLDDQADQLAAAAERDAEYRRLQSRLGTLSEVETYLDAGDDWWRCRECGKWNRDDADYCPCLDS